jgi:exopolysaccharide biosynthesis WecB/TagA/CpsF family protein
MSRRVRAPIARSEILGVPVAMLEPAAALDAIASLADAAPPVHVAYVNAHTLNLAARDPAYRAVLRRASLVLNDGSGVAIAARLRGRRFPANLNGSDFNPRILARAAERDWPVFFLGGRPGVAAEAGRQLQARIPGLHLCGARDGYFAEDETPRVVAEVRDSGAAVLMVALGNPRQERWLDRHLAATGARLGLGVGGFFDFAAARVPRAPAWMRRLGVEWVFRLAQEPRRLWRRYLLGNPLFLARVLRAEAIRRIRWEGGGAH